MVSETNDGRKKILVQFGLNVLKGSGECIWQETPKHRDVKDNAMSLKRKQVSPSYQYIFISIGIAHAIVLLAD